MNQRNTGSRNQGGGPPRGPGHFDHPHDRDRYASREPEYEDMPSVTNREWGPARMTGDTSFGQAGLGGYSSPQGHGQKASGEDRQHHGQGGYAKDQGRHAQSGQGRGGSQFARDEVGYARGPEPSRQSQRGRGPLNYLLSDARIADDLIDRLTDDALLDASEILVMVENGVATLTGEVPERWMKRRAEDIAAGVGGMRDVRNKLIVDHGVKAFGPPGAAVRSRDRYDSGFSSSIGIGDADADAQQ